MVISHNLLAMNASRNSKINRANITKSIEKLSSGFRLNLAVDDAAGLSISETMRSQIKGLDQASANAQDGVSLLQTADGAMNEVHSLLQRMREITVQAANDSNTDDDRQAIQDEIGQLSNEIDSISSNTMFNNRKLLDGSLYSYKNKDSLEKIMKNLKGSWLNDALTRIQDSTGLSLNSDVSLTVSFQDLGNSTIASMGSYNGGNVFNLNINTYFLTDDMSYGASGPTPGGLLFDRLISHETTHAVMRHNSNPSLDIPTWFSEGLAEVVHGASDYRFYEGNTTLSDDYAKQVMQNLDFYNNQSGYNVYPGGYLAVSYLYNYMNDGGAAFKAMLQNMDSYTSFSQLIEDTFNVPPLSYQDLMTKMKTDATTDISNFIQNQCKIDFSDGESDALDKDALPEDIVTQTGSEQAITMPTDTISVGGHNMTIHWPDISEATPFRLQIGTSTDQSLEISIRSISSSSLFGTLGVSVLNHVSAGQSLKTLDNATASVSRERSKIGAITNRLEHIINYLDNTSENTTAAESRIRETDMAGEMVTLSKNNILEQASQAMLSQANKQSDFVLQLLG